ncbi:MAG: hypothetical protein RhofKO_15740 [Rhodothermales bacterium]
MQRFMRPLIVLFTFLVISSACDSVTPIEPALPTEEVKPREDAPMPIDGGSIDVFVGEPALSLDLNAYFLAAAFDTTGIVYRIVDYDSTRLGLSLASPTTLQLEAAFAAEPSALEVDLTATSTTGALYPIKFEVNLRNACLEPDPLPESERIRFNTYLGEPATPSLTTADPRFGFAPDSTHMFMHIRSCNPNILEAKREGVWSSSVRMLSLTETATPIAITTVTPSGTRHRTVVWYQAYDACQLAQAYPEAMFLPLEPGQTWTYSSTTSTQGQNTTRGEYMVTWTVRDLTPCIDGQRSFTIEEQRVGKLYLLYAPGNQYNEVDQTRTLKGAIRGRYFDLEEYTEHLNPQWLNIDAANDTLGYNYLSNDTPGASLFGTVYRDTLALVRGEGLHHLRISYFGKRWGGHTDLNAQ